MSDQRPSTTISSSKDEEQLSDILQSNLSISSTTTPTTTNPTTTAATVDNDDDDRWKPHDPATIDYGPFSSSPISSSTSPSSTTTTHTPNNDNNNDKFYLTTAINYTNGAAHIGHAYEICTSDSIVRYFRMKNSSSQVRFCTGSDEHGQKIANVAEAEGKQPIEICDKYVNGFQRLNQRLLISNDDYVRTTSKRHSNTAQALWNRCASNINPTTGFSDVYLSKYNGWYNIREETFVSDLDAKLADFKDPVSNLPLKKVEEESYFFRMSSYRDRLVTHIKNNPKFIMPKHHSNMILKRLEGNSENEKEDDDDEGLRDLSISRTTFDWGISVPDGFDKRHVMYVWFDALSNYLTGVDGLGVNNDNDDKKQSVEKGNNASNLSSFWPASVHVIGKDILWFHSVIWPTILMSAGLPLPETIYAHGFVNDSEGKKMAKSVGNVVNPHDMIDKYGTDAFRWYLCKEAPYGGELSFSERSLIDATNADLCDTLGNLVHRATSLCGRYCHGKVPECSIESTPPAINFGDYLERYRSKMDNFELESGANIAMSALREVNGYLTDKAPWHIKGDGVEATELRNVVVRTTLESVYAIAHLLVPFLPFGTKGIFERLSTPPVPQLDDLLLGNDSSISDKQHLSNLSVGTKVNVGHVLYAKFGQDGEEDNGGKTKVAAGVGKGKSLPTKETHAEAQKRKKERKAREIASSQTGQKKAGGKEDQPEFTKLDIRVGQILKAWEHRDADRLFCEEVDVGEKDAETNTKVLTREIASGLRGHYDISDLIGRKVLVVCNLKASRIIGFASHGMVLAAKATDGTKVEFVDPPLDSEIGERVHIDGLSTAAEPLSAAQVKKRKVFDIVAKNMKTDENGIATWEGKAICTKAGQCRAATLAGAAIS